MPARDPEVAVCILAGIWNLQQRVDVADLKKYLLFKRSRLASIRQPLWRLRSFDPIETTVAVLLLMVLYFVAVKNYAVDSVLSRVAVTEVQSTSQAERICVQEHWAVSGEFPSASDCVRTSNPKRAFGHYVTDIKATSSGPAFVYTVVVPWHSGNRQIGIWLSAGPGEWPATFSWRCGTISVAPGMRPLSTDATLAPWESLPTGCRGAKPNVAL